MHASSNAFLASTGEKGDLNQYWFSSNTVAAFVSEICLCKGQSALVSSPSVYFSLPDDARKRSKVLDYDRQWESDPGYVFYDFNDPTNLPVELLGRFDFILVDPPFITREVWEKYVVTVRLLAASNARILCTTIAENAQMMSEILGLAPTLFRPSIPNLVYQYNIYVNYNSVTLDRFNPEIDDEDWRKAPYTKQPLDCGRSELPLETSYFAVSEQSDSHLHDPTNDVLPPAAALLAELREQMGNLKKSLEGVLMPLQTAIRRREVGGDAATAANAKVEAALQSADSNLKTFENWLDIYLPEVVEALSDVFAQASQEEDAWHLKSVQLLIAKGKDEPLLSMAAYQQYALQCRQVSTMIFRHSNQILDRIKALKQAQKRSLGSSGI